MHRNSGWAGHAYMIVAGGISGFRIDSPVLSDRQPRRRTGRTPGHYHARFPRLRHDSDQYPRPGALTAPWIAPEARLAMFFRRPVVLGAIESYIAIVGIVYTLLLDFRASEGPPLWADVLLPRHQSRPVLNLLLFLVRRGGLHWRHPVLLPGYPLSYVVAFLGSSVCRPLG